MIRNASLVLTMDPKLGQGPLGRREDTDVLIDRDRISAVGKDLPDDGAQVLDGHGKIVLPGFVDLHNHLWQALIRGCATDKDLHGWLSGCVLPLSGSSISSADGYAGTRLTTLDVISSGITPVTDWSHAFNADFARGNLRALEDSRLRFVFAYTTGSPRRWPRSAGSSGSRSTRILWRTCRSVCIRRPRTTKTRWPRNAWPTNSASRSTSTCTSRRPIRPPGRWTRCAGRERCGPTAVNFAPEFDWISQLVFNTQPANVEWVFVSGRALKRDGRIVGDQGRVIADAQAASDRIQKLLDRNAHPGVR